MVLCCPSYRQPCTGKLRCQTFFPEWLCQEIYKHTSLKSSLDEKIYAVLPTHPEQLSSQIWESALERSFPLEKEAELLDTEDTLENITADVYQDTVYEVVQGYFPRKKEQWMK